MDMSNGLMFAIFNLDMQMEALIRTLGEESPDFRQRMSANLSVLRQKEYQRVVLDTKNRIVDANDGMWLGQLGISDQPKTDE